MTNSTPQDGARLLDAAAAAMGRRSAIVGVAMLVTLLATGLVLDRSSASRYDDARHLHLASRQMVLAQQAAITAFGVVTGDAGGPTVRPAIERLPDEIRALTVVREQLGYRVGSTTRTLPTEVRGVLEGRDGLSATLDDFVTDLRTVADPATPAAARAAAFDGARSTAISRLSHQLEAAAEAERRHAEEGLASGRWLTRVLGGATIALLVLLFVVVLRPIVTATQVTSRALRRAQDADHRRQHWHREFAAIADHELRTPVTVLSGLARTLDEHHDDLDPPLRRDIVHRLRRQGDVMVDLLAELSTVAGLAGAKRQVTTFPLRTLLQEVRGGREDVEVRTQPLLIHTDRERLRLLCGELVDNGLTHGLPPVVIEAVRHGKALVLLVTDAGPGIDEVDVERLLKPFVIGQDSRNHQRSHGRGLGLAMVASIVEDEAGELSYRRGQHDGTWVVRLPGAVVGLDGPPNDPAHTRRRTDAPELEPDLDHDLAGTGAGD